MSRHATPEEMAEAAALNPQPAPPPKPAAQPPPAVDLRALPGEVLARLCVAATAQHAGHRPLLELWVEGHLPHTRKVKVWQSVTGKVTGWWKAPEPPDAPIVRTRLRVWVDELWRELGRRGVDLEAVQAQLRAERAKRAIEAQPAEASPAPTKEGL